MDERRKNKHNCPKCGKQLAISGLEIYCIDPSCGWHKVAKRMDDGKLPNLNDMMRDMQ